MGRAGHSDVMGGVPLSASAIGLEGQVTVVDGAKKPFETPKAMSIAEIETTIEDYGNAAANAIAAGFDGVQVHGANGYLVDQFIQSCSNVRVDEYGGSLENRLRFLKRVLEATTAAAGPERTWIRLSPNGAFQSMGSADNLETFDAAIQMAAGFKVGCVEVMDGLSFGFHKKTEPYTLERVRKNVNIGNADRTSPTAVMGNVGHTQESANREIGAGNADLISIGRSYMSNPDLPERFRDGVPLAAVPAQADWWKKQGADGYTSFPRATKKDVSTSNY